MSKRILLTGVTGFLGRHTLPVLQQTYGVENVQGVSSSDYDLMDFKQVMQLLNTVHPSVVVHYAAYSGGIGANKAYPADFYYRNTILTAHMFEACSSAGVEKLIYPIGGCSYPANAISPIDEQQLWCGLPQVESRGYSAAKMMGIIAMQAYRQQRGLDTAVIIPGNMYGEYDNFSPLASHVVPAMIRRYYEAKRNKIDKVVMWGSGRPERDFVYAGDVAAMLPFFVERYSSDEPVNISSGTRTSILQLATLIAELIEFEGTIEWDTGKPDGQMIKIFDTRRINGLGQACRTPLREGLKKTIQWFSKNYENQTDGIRL